jgi:tetratricopeptide (TPR) repeat protein
MKRTITWKPFPYPDERFDYPENALKKHWNGLHLGDREAYPDTHRIAELCEGKSGVIEAAFKGDFAALSHQLLHAWRLYHRGAFQGAAEAGMKLGPIGYAVANKATTVHANYVETDARTRCILYQEAAARAEAAISVLPEWANSHYLYAYALGRYSQEISVLEALAQGFGGKIKAALDRALELEPEHAEAHIAMGTYHAEIVSKVGAILGALTYGASKDAAIVHYQKAIRLHPKSAIAHVEFADGLLLLYGRSRRSDARRHYSDACALNACDAMEQLCIELAKSRLEE